MENTLATITGPAWKGIRYFTTQVYGGYSQGPWGGLNLGEHCGDDPEHVALNRALLRRHLPSEPHWLQQVHGTDLYHAQQPNDSPVSWHEAPQADAAWTTTKNSVLAILTADCLPVVLADAQGQIVGIAHAGWRGLVNGVLEKLFLQLKSQCRHAQQWQAWIGPGISQQHFEVGAEVYQAFCEIDIQLKQYFFYKKETNKYHADLPGIAQFLLLKLESSIVVNLSQACTFSEQSYYSYRRERKTGRIVTLAWRI